MGLIVHLYSKPGCSLCAAAKEKFALLGVTYQEHDLAYHIAPHHGWREDGSHELMSAHTFYDSMPLIRVGGNIFNYSGGMKEIRRLLTA